MPSKLINKLRALGLNTSLCNWTLDFLICRPLVVRVGNNTSATLILNTGAPQGCVLTPLLYYTHDCTSRHDSNTIIKFADNTKVIGLITDNDETAHKEEVRDLVMWCQDNNLSLNVIKTKEMIVDYTIDSILTGCITTWYGNCSASDRKALQRVARTAQYITGAKLPTIQDLYSRVSKRKALKIVKDSSHPSHRLFSLLPHGKWYLRDSLGPRGF